MTAQGEELLAWLDRAIGVREQVAQGAARNRGTRWVRPVDTAKVRISAADLSFSVLNQEIAEHIIYNSPESVLRRCAADRKLIAAHPITRDVIDVYPDGRHGFGCSVCHTEDLLTIGSGWCDSLLALAEGYGWTEGER
ncbi:DUF6221 family protein [Streptomyces tendae]|uniref:DUF6221 family protein n=1 Tax=Streptomyces tendae TaxID=1932 RepID=UPI003802B559